MYLRLYFIILVFIALFNLLNNVLVNCIPSLNGRYTSNIKNFKLTVPVKVSEWDEFRTFKLPHFYKQNYAMNRRRRKRSLNDPDMVHYRIEFNDERFHAELWPNHGLISPNAIFENNQPNVDVNKRIVNKLDDKRMCHYTGRVKGSNESKIAISTCYGLAGSITLDGRRYFIEPVEGHSPNKNGEHLHVVYENYPTDENDMKTSNCGTNTNWEDAWREQFFNKYRSKEDIEKRSAESVHRYLEVLIVCDKKFLEHHKHRDHHMYVLTIMNMVADFYHDYSSGNQMDVVVVRIMYLDKEEEEIDLDINPNADETLKSFCKWQKKINPKDLSNPNHHDIAVLLTRHDICADNLTNCGLMGLAYVASACSSDKPCAINEDGGLVLAIVVAHEMGHVMGCAHDKEGDSTCAAQDEDESYFVMAPYVHLFTTRWSSCSRGYLTSLFENGLGECLNDEPEVSLYKFRNVLPGVVYDADAQCQILFPNSKVCPYVDESEFCTTLMCMTEPRTCLSNNEPPADGTKCGANMWCYRKKCVEIGARPAALDGGFGKWSPFTPCSRTCGGGVETSTRECDNPIPEHGGRYCIGERKRVKICKLDPCPTGTPSYRDQQCVDHNTKPFLGKLHSWKGYFKKEEPCVLYCLSDSNMFAKLEPRAKDGTRCKPGTSNMCIGGACKKIGCDGEIDSDASEDICGVCNGDGTQCKIVDGMYDKEKGRLYTKVILIPTGARNILFEEMAPSMNTLAVSDRTESKFYLNGGKSEDNDGEKKFNDVVGVYKHTEPKKETLVIHGPLTEDLLLHVVFYRQENVGYHYKWAEPTLDVSYTPHYHWEVADWEDCSKKCGGGIQSPKFCCIEAKAGKVSESYCENTDKPEMDDKVCNETPCETKWKVGKWGICHACKYKSGVRSREVECVRESPIAGADDTLEEDKECHETKPGTRELCNSHKKCKERRDADGLPDELMEDVWRQLHRYRRHFKKRQPLVKKQCTEGDDVHKYELSKLDVGATVKDRVPSDEIRMIEVPLKQSHLSVDLSDQSFETMGDKVGDTLETGNTKILTGAAAAKELKKYSNEHYTT